MTRRTVGRRAEIGIVYLTGLAQGLALVTFPAASNIFTSPDFHDLSSSEYGTMFLPMIICAILASSLAGALARRWSLKRIFVLGLVFNMTSMAVLALSNAFVATHTMAYGCLLAAMAALGAGFGATITALNTYATSFFPGKSDTALTALHAMLGIGTALAPLLLGVFVSLGVWWGDPIAILGFFLALGFASLVPQLEGPPAAQEPRPGGPLALLRGLPQRIYGYAAIAVLYGICETIFGNWATIYLHEGKGLSVQWAGFALATFWSMVTAGRVLMAAVAVWLSPQRIYLAMPILICGAFLIIPMVRGDTGNVIAFGVAGLACSAFLPLSISFATQEFPQMVEVVSGGMMAAFMLGFGVGAYGVGPLREVGGLSLSTIYTGTSGFAAGMAILAFFLIKPRWARILSLG